MQRFVVRVSGAFVRTHYLVRCLLHCAIRIVIYSPYTLALPYGSAAA